MSSKDEAASQKNRPCVSTDALRSTITNRRHWFQTFQAAKPKFRSLDGLE